MSMHRPPAGNCMFWPHGEEQGHQDLWIGVQYLCTGTRHSIVCVSKIANKNAIRSCRWVCHFSAQAPSTALPMFATWRRNMPSRCLHWRAISMHRPSAEHCVCWPHGEEQRHQGLRIWCAISMHRASARHDVCWPHGDQKGHPDLWIGVPYQCTGPQHSIACVSRMANTTATWICGLVCHLNAPLPPAQPSVCCSHG